MKEDQQKSSKKRRKRRRRKGGEGGKEWKGEEEVKPEEQKKRQTRKYTIVVITLKTTLLISRLSHDDRDVIQIIRHVVKERPKEPQSKVGNKVRSARYRLHRVTISQHDMHREKEEVVVEEEEEGYHYNYHPVLLTVISIIRGMLIRK